MVRPGREQITMGVAYLHWHNRNDNTYAVVTTSGLGWLLCLGAEVYWRWGQQAIDIVPRLARERTRGLEPRIRKGIDLGYPHRWWGLVGVALQKNEASIAR